MLRTETRRIREPERTILEAAEAHAGSAVTAAGTLKWILVWTAGLALLGLLGYGLAVLAPAPTFVASLLAGVLLMAGILCVYAIITLISSYFHQRRVAREFRRHPAPQIRRALADGTVRVMRVRASAVVTIEEAEDEGAGFIFDVGDGRILFLKGQQYYAADEKMAWPNAEFEIVRTAMGDNWIGIFCYGAPLEPMEVLQSADCSEDIIWAEREDVVEARLEDFVRSIRRAA